MKTIAGSCDLPPRVRAMIGFGIRLRADYRGIRAGDPLVFLAGDGALVVVGVRTFAGTRVVLVPAHLIDGWDEPASNGNEEVALAAG